MIVLSIGAISAQDVDDAVASGDDNVVLGDSEPVSGTVSGGVDVVTENSWNTTGELSYAIPSDAKTIKSADVYVNVYGGSAKNTHGANANITITTAGGETKYNEALWIEDGTADGTVYTVNNHTTKCYSDYMIHYDVTDMLKDLNGTNLKIKVDTFEMENKSFDGRIKLIGLVLAYDDGDDDSISYWINDDQQWSKGNVTVTFDTEKITAFSGATLTNVVLSSGDGTYKINDEFLGDADSHVSGNYYQYNKWNVKDAVKANQKTDLNVMYAGTSAYGSIKNVLSILTVYNLITDISIVPEYTSVPSAYAGTNNTLTIKVKTNKAGNYSIKLLADGVEVNGTDIALVKGDNAVLLTDPTVRDIDESTVNGADNNKVVYSVNVEYGNDIVGNCNLTVPVVYNGYLGTDLEFNVTGYDSDLILNDEFSGDLVIDIKDASTYLGASDMNRTDVWTIGLDESCGLDDAYLFVPYNWFNGKTYNETKDMFKLTFNGEEILPINLFRDQGNLGNYGKYGYGILVYRVDNLINIHGNNTLVLNKVNPTPAVYPSALVYWYNAPDGSFKELSIAFGADLLSNDYNKSGRTVKADTVIDANVGDVKNATMYILAAGAQKGESNIIVNGKVFEDVWDGTTKTTDLFTAEITDVVADSNNVSFVATGSTILALPQIIVVDTGVAISVDSIKTEYTSVPTAYAGTNNTLTVTVSTNKDGEYDIYLFDGVKEVNKVNMTLTNGSNTILLTDPTIRPIDETTENGANNTVVTYSVLVNIDNYYAANYVKLPVLYNGNLGHDLEYNITGFENAAPIAISGDVVIDVKDVGSYLGASAMNRTDVWAVSLDNSSTVTNAFIYVPYNWFNAKTYTEDANMFNVTFNGASIAPVAWYRDQGNLGNYGKYGYGVFVYDVSDLIAAGDNTLVLNKVNPTPAVYPSVLVYMYNTTGSSDIKDVYIVNGADLLAGSSNNVAKRPVFSNSQIDIKTTEVNAATLYVLAASAQAGEGNIVFNGQEFANVWNGTSSTTDLFTTDVTSLIKQSNEISFVATGSTILELPQILVTSKEFVSPVITVEKVNGSAAVSGVLKDSNNKPISNATISYVIGNETNNLTTDENGAFVIQGANNATIVISYAGDSYSAPANASITLENIAPARVDTIITVDAAFTRNATDFGAGERGGFFYAILTDINGNPLANKTVQIAVNGPIYNKTTDEQGRFGLQVNLAAANTYTYALSFQGDEQYNAAPLASSKLTVVKKSTSISASAKTLKSTAKTKKITVTLKTIKNAYDKKTYLKAGKKVTLKINGVTYTAKINSKGQATFSIKLTKKGKFTALIKFAGDKSYKASSKKIKVTIK